MWIISTTYDTQICHGYGRDMPWTWQENPWRENPLKQIFKDYKDKLQAQAWFKILTDTKTYQLICTTISHYWTDSLIKTNLNGELENTPKVLVYIWRCFENINTLIWQPLFSKRITLANNTSWQRKHHGVGLWWH